MNKDKRKQFKYSLYTKEEGYLLLYLINPFYLFLSVSPYSIT